MEKTASEIRQAILARFPDIAKVGADLTAKGREQIKKKNFALPAQKKYPIHDLPHARNALARAAQHASPATESKIRQKVYSKFPGLKERAKEAQAKLAESDSFAVRHPHLSTFWGPALASNVGQAVGGPVGSLAGLGTEIAGTHFLSKGLKKQREQAGRRGEPESFALRHPYLTGIGGRMAGTAGGAGLGALAGYGIGEAVGGGGVQLPKELFGGGHLGPGEVGALLGAMGGATAGGVTGRLLGTRAIMKGQERELAKAKKPKGEKKEASLGDPAANLAAAVALGESLAERELESIRKEAMAEATRLLMAEATQTKTAAVLPTPPRLTLQDAVQRESDLSARVLAKLASLRPRS